MIFWKWLHSTIIPSLKPTYWYGPHKDNQEELIWTEERIKQKTRRGWKVKVHKRLTGTVDSTQSHENYTLHDFPKNVIADRGTAFIIGSARLRQLRVRRGILYGSNFRLSVTFVQTILLYCAYDRFFIQCFL